MGKGKGMGFAGAVLAMAATFAMNADAAASAWTDVYSVITVLESYGDDTHVAGLALAPNPAGCTVTNWAKVDYRLTLAKKEGLARVLTAAFLAGRQVQVKLQGDYCQDTGASTYPAIYGVRVK